jgi:hypothetical protein
MNRQFAALRGLAIVVVVFYHAIELGSSIPREWGYPAIGGIARLVLLLLQQIGPLAVPTFLFISGCFVAYAAAGTPPKLAWKTVWSNLKRLLWPYLLWSILFYIIIYFQRHETYSLPGYIKQLIVGYPYNFVPLLLFWLVLAPILVQLTRRFSNVLIAVILVYQLILLNLEYPGSLGFTFPNWVSFLKPPVLHSTLAVWGIYYPLGLIYSVNAKSMTPWLQKNRAVLWAITGVFFVFGFLSRAEILKFQLAEHVYPLTFVLLLPTIKRDAIPWVRQLEQVGKHSYGLYLTNLIILDLALVSVKALMPNLLNYRIWLMPPLFVLALVIPLAVMSKLARSPAKGMNHYVFG